MRGGRCQLALAAHALSVVRDPAPLIRSPSLAPPPPPPPPLAFHHGRFNPIEKFNGWLKGNVADDIAHGREGATRDNIIEAVHSAIAHRSADLPKKCQGWIDYLFAPSGG